MSDANDLFEAAKRVRLNAHAPYSGFKVGAAIRDQTGAIHVGCNVENVAYPEGTCAEAGAIAAMCAAGGNRAIAEVVVIADSTRGSSGFDRHSDINDTGRTSPRCIFCATFGPMRQAHD